MSDHYDALGALTEQLVNDLQSRFRCYGFDALHWADWHLPSRGPGNRNTGHTCPIMILCTDSPAAPQTAVLAGQITNSENLGVLCKCSRYNIPRILERCWQYVSRSITSQLSMQSQPLVATKLCITPNRLSYPQSVVGEYADDLERYLQEYGDIMFITITMRFDTTIKQPPT